MQQRHCLFAHPTYCASTLNTLSSKVSIAMVQQNMSHETKGLHTMKMMYPYFAGSLVPCLAQRNTY
eukprot:1158122-Pelagomonas_calceolata.AAC.1